MTSRPIKRFISARLVAQRTRVCISFYVPHCAAISYFNHQQVNVTSFDIRLYAFLNQSA